jgi:hypothetical protein
MHRATPASRQHCARRQPGHRSPAPRTFLTAAGPIIRRPVLSWPRYFYPLLIHFALRSVGVRKLELFLLPRSFLRQRRGSAGFLPDYLPFCGGGRE